MVTWMSAVSFAIERANATSRKDFLTLSVRLRKPRRIFRLREIAASVGQDSRKPARSVARSTAAASTAPPAQAARERSASAGSESENAPKRKLSAARLMQAVAKRGSARRRARKYGWRRLARIAESTQGGVLATVVSHDRCLCGHNENVLQLWHRHAPLSVRYVPGNHLYESCALGHVHVPVCICTHERL